MNKPTNERLATGIAWGMLALLVFGVLAIPMFAWPYYSVWSSGMRGKAMLRQAEHEKQIMIEQARSEVEAAKLRAEAIRLVGQASKEFPEYRQQEFIGAFGQAIQSGQVEQIIYVPTEANIPIVENRQR